eukprot:991772-Pyramimonas_sp.AAC.1
MGFGLRPRLSTMPGRPEPLEDHRFTAVWVTEAWTHVLHVARDEGWNLEVDFEFERYRDQERTAHTNRVGDAQTAWVPGLTAFEWRREENPYLRGQGETDEEKYYDIWPWLQKESD